MNNQEPEVLGRVAPGVYESYFEPIDPRYRYKRIIAATVVFLFFGYLMFSMFGTEFIKESWHEWVLAYVGPYALYVAYHLRCTRVQKLTKDGMIAKAKDEADAAQAQHVKQQLASAKWDARLKPVLEFADKGVVRYPGGIVLLIFSVMVAGDETIPNHYWLGAVLFFAALFCMREAVLWLIGLAIVAGIGSLFIGAVAALPVSAAIIIGAWIIASSSRK